MLEHINLDFMSKDTPTYLSGCFFLIKTHVEIRRNPSNLFVTS